MSTPERKYKLNKCDRGWFTLNKIDGETDVRFCDTCHKSVHWCKTEKGVAEAVEKKWCIAAENKLVFKDVTPSTSNHSVYIGGVEEASTYLKGGDEAQVKGQLPRISEFDGVEL